jgi:phosphatidylserine/phosphatidylglycerophosphate/cardiolipin synthase-like enzyme
MLPLHNAKLAAGPALAALLLGAVLGAACARRAGAGDPAGPPAAEVGPAQVSPAFGRDCEAAVVTAIREARQEILVAIYSFTRRRIANALADAAARGVRVEVRYDAGSFAEDPRGMQAVIGVLRKRGVRCAAAAEAPGTDGPEPKMHHKFMVVDLRRVVTGSFNYTSSAAERNDENVVRIESEAAARAYAREFARLSERGGAR